MGETIRTEEEQDEPKKEEEKRNKDLPVAPG